MIMCILKELLCPLAVHSLMTLLLLAGAPEKEGRVIFLFPWRLRGSAIPEKVVREVGFWHGLSRAAALAGSC